MVYSDKLTAPYEEGDNFEYEKKLWRWWRSTLLGFWAGALAELASCLGLKPRGFGKFLEEFLFGVGERVGHDQVQRHVEVATALFVGNPFPFKRIF